MLFRSTSPYCDITCHSSMRTTPIVQTDSDTTLTTLTFVKSGNDESNTPRSTRSGYQGCPELENRSPLDADTSRASESSSLNMEPNAFVLGPKTPVTMTGFTQEHLKMRKSPIFNKRHDGLSEAATTEHSAALSESPAGSTVVLASENPSKTAEFSQKCQKQQNCLFRKLSTGQTKPKHSIPHPHFLSIHLATSPVSVRHQ